MKQIKNDILAWISTNKVRLLISFIIAFIISIILPIWGYTTNDAKLSDCVAIALIFTFIFYEVSKKADEIGALFADVIGWLILFIIGIGGLYIAIKIIKFMWYC